MTKMFVFIALFLMSNLASADWVGGPIVFNPQTSKSLSTALVKLNYPDLYEGLRKTGVTPMLTCTANGVACNLIVLSKDILPKDCSSFPPKENIQSVSVSFSRAESWEIQDRFHKAQIPVVNGVSSVGSHCGGLIVECANGDDCKAQIYQF